MAAAAALAMLLLVAPSARADVKAHGCQNQTNRPTSNLVEAGVTSSGKTSTYTFKSVDAGGTKGVPGLVEYCVFPGEGNTLPKTVTVDETPGTGAEGFDTSFFEDPACLEEGCFSFHRETGSGNEGNIPFDGTERTMGTATWETSAPAAEEQLLTLHINDKTECQALYGTEGEAGSETIETCWVVPGEIEEEEEIPPADDLTASKTAEPSLQRLYEWEIEKEVDATKAEISEGKATFNYTVTVTETGHTDGGWLVSGEVKVFNTNSGAVNGVEVEDAIYKGAGELDANASCEVEGGSGGTEIEAESSRGFPYTCEYSGEPESGEETNVAVVSWPEQPVDGKLLDEGEAKAEAEIDWSSAVVEGEDESVTVEDSLHGLLGEVEVGESPKSFEYSEEFEGEPGTCTPYDNKASFLTSDTETEGSDSAEVEVCVGADLEVSKTAEPSFERSFPWSIEKTVDKEEVKTTGKNASFDYTIEVKKGAGVDSGWLVKGQITVSNPNDWEPVTVDVADEIEADTGAVCSVTGGEEAEIPAGGSEEFGYECLYTEAPASSTETNKATASWDAEAAHTPEGEASGTAAVNWGEPTKTVDNCVTEVTDTVDGTTTKLEGELCESKTFEETIVFPVKSGCVDHTNVAQTTTVDSEKTLEDEVTVRVCGPVQSGALTMGFWQNKNGQGIITGGHETSKVCDSGTWLRLFPPFADLSPTANCKKVAEYVTTVIKAANAGGAAMNAMLKGQMLATALDVYFSDPALGGNQIKAPTPLGGQKIDLTQVCKNIPACTTLEDTSAAFGGAKSLTVLQLLTYAGSKSNSGGTVWYEQVKATQGLAKDTFDAINNQVAFEP
ncbi:MAG TPA: hypothetical protein VHI77_01830 [Solirubrobacterales bacterium]|nr:hypothetical protein [Solirubrobacterales bacterium]